MHSSATARRQPLMHDAGRANTHRRRRSGARALMAMTRAGLGTLAFALVSCASMAVSEPLSHEQWSALLEDCVLPTPDGGSTEVDYACFSRQQLALDEYLATLTGVSPKDFATWSQTAQLAFLINAYNAWTVELILTAWPELDSIRDLGSLLRSPWKKRFIPLFGQELSLDDIEHGMIREAGRFDDPRIHFAVNCASIGCPALRRDAYTGAHLDEQLDDQTRRFLADRTRNRYADGQLYLSSLFKWYGDDFKNGWRGADSLEAFLARYGEALALPEPVRITLAAGEKVNITFLDYDWALNALTR